MQGLQEPGQPFAGLGRAPEVDDGGVMLGLFGDRLESRPLQLLLGESVGARRMGAEGAGNVTRAVEQIAG